MENNEKIIVPCTRCIHRQVCIYERAMQENADCLREVVSTLQSVAISPFTVNIQCGQFLADDTTTYARGGVI